MPMMVTSARECKAGCRLVMRVPMPMNIIRADRMMLRLQGNLRAFIGMTKCHSVPQIGEASALADGGYNGTLYVSFEEKITSIND